MTDLKRKPSSKPQPDYPAADEILRNRREFLALAGKIAAVAAVPAFATACMGIAPDPEPVDPGVDTIDDVEGEFPQLRGDMPAPDAFQFEDVEDEFPPLAGEPIMPDTISPKDVKDIEDEFPPLSGDEARPRHRVIPCA